MKSAKRMAAVWGTMAVLGASPALAQAPAGWQGPNVMAPAQAVRGAGRAPCELAGSAPSGFSGAYRPAEGIRSDARSQREARGPNIIGEAVSSSSAAMRTPEIERGTGRPPAATTPRCPHCVAI